MPGVSNWRRCLPAMIFFAALLGCVLPTLPWCQHVGPGNSKGILDGKRRAAFRAHISGDCFKASRRERTLSKTHKTHNVIIKNMQQYLIEYLKQKSWTLRFPSISHIGPLIFWGWKNAWPPLRSSMRHDEPSSSEPIGNLHGESMVGNLWLKFSKNIGTNIARIWIILDHVSHRSLFLFVVCVFSVYSRGRGWMREWMTRSKLQVKVLGTSQNLIHLSSSHQAFPDENCPKPKSERNFQNPFSRLFGFFWLGAPRFFPGFFTKGHESIPSESEVQRGSAHSEGGTRSYRKDAAPEAIGMGKSTQVRRGKIYPVKW